MESFRFYVEEGIPLVYDVTNQVVPAYGSKRILADLQANSLACGSARWHGGEYVSGTPASFRERNILAAVKHGTAPSRHLQDPHKTYSHATSTPSNY
jgi:hypothetical protein